MFGRGKALLQPRSKDFVAISNPSARQQAIRFDTRTSQSPCLFRATAQSSVAPAYAHRVRRQALNGNSSGDRVGDDRLKCPGCGGTALAIDIVLISTGHRFTFSEVFCPSGQSPWKATMKPTSVDGCPSAESHSMSWNFIALRRALAGDSIDTMRTCRRVLRIPSRTPNPDPARTANALHWTDSCSE